MDQDEQERRWSEDEYLAWVRRDDRHRAPTVLYVTLGLAALLALTIWAVWSV